MKFEEKLRELSKEEIWEEYCGFLELTMEQYMNIQNRLLKEQMELWCHSLLGQSILKGQVPEDIEQFRQMVPLTTYYDYADILLSQKTEMLPEEPVIWIQTTWEGGKHPIKTAPYTKGMLKTYQHNILATLILCTSQKKGSFDISPSDNVLYALAPLPYPTGLMPVALNEEISIGFLPPVQEAQKLSFSERNKLGFKMGMKKGIEYLFGMGSVSYFVSLSISSLSGSGQSSSLSDKLKQISPSMMLRYMKAKKICKKENRSLLPKDLFQLKGFVCAGTDSQCYKDDLEHMWGVRPMEMFAGTEPTCIGTETWSRNGMYFFPDACFYEFIPETEMNENLDDPTYTPRTLTMEQVKEGEKYELVLTVLKGGAFARYRVGDVYRCLGFGGTGNAAKIPRFQYIDRVPTVIDIAGFTRITENSIQRAIELSGLPIHDWIALKEYNENNRPYLHMYIEIKNEALLNHAISTQLLKDQLSLYFKYLDEDYKDLKKILGMEPLEITVLKSQTFEHYYQHAKKPLRHVNPPDQEVATLLRPVTVKGGAGCV